MKRDPQCTIASCDDIFTCFSNSELNSWKNDLIEILVRANRFYKNGCDTDTKNFKQIVLDSATVSTGFLELGVNPFELDTDNSNIEDVFILVY